MAVQQEERKEKPTKSIETERSFILTHEGFEHMAHLIEGAPFEDITQIYEIPVDRHGKPNGERGYRYRASVLPDGHIYFSKNIKQQTNVAGKQEEEEETIKKKDYMSRYASPFYGPITKRRFHSLGFEVDVFGPPFDGLVKIEREDKVNDTGDFFYPPKWMEEITDDPGFSNRKLARDGVPLGTARHNILYLLTNFHIVTPDTWLEKSNIPHGWHSDVPAPPAGPPVPLWERYWHVPLDHIPSCSEDDLLQGVIDSVAGEWTHISPPSFQWVGIVEVSPEKTVQIRQKHTPPMTAHHLTVKRGNEKGKIVPVTRRVFNDYASRTSMWHERIRYEGIVSGKHVDVDIVGGSNSSIGKRAILSTSFKSVKERRDFVPAWNAQEILLT